MSRFRISRAGSPDPTGPADDGEVEDHTITITTEIGDTTVTEVDVFDNTEGTLTLIGPNMPTGGASIGVSGPTTVHVFFEGPNEGDAFDNLIRRPGQSQDGLDEVQTEIISMNLTGDLPGAGPITVRLNPDRRSMGWMTETENANPGTLDVAPFTTPTGGGNFNVDSFFDIFVEVEVGQPGLAGHMLLHNREPIRIGGLIENKPPGPGETLHGNPNNPIPLFTPNGEPSGFSLGPISHTPNPVPTTGSVHGFKWNDLNGDGIWDDGEPGLAGVPIIAYRDGSPVASVHTMADDDNTPNEDETGMYWLEDLDPGDYVIMESPDTSQWMQTYPHNWMADLSHDTTFNNSNQTGATGSASFIRQPDGSVEWWLFWDGLSGTPTNAHLHLTADGVAGGSPIQDLWAIRDTSADTANSAHGTLTPTPDLLDKMNNGNAYVNIHTTANGGGEIAGLIVGDGSHHVTVVTGEDVTGIDFGNKSAPQEEWDFGDLPDDPGSTPVTGPGNYRTVLANDGARHMKVVDNVILGDAWDKDADGQPTAAANGDDIDADGDDEDGVVFNGPLTAGGSASVDVTVTGSGSTGHLDAWIDFNADGDFDDTIDGVDEHVFFAFTVIPNGVAQQMSFDIPASANVGDTYARFRIRTDTNTMDWFGPWPNGEVEDYEISIEAAPPTDLDYGDAPDITSGTGPGDYNTLASNDGPSHVATGPILGTERDAEQDAHQSSDADGDDNNPAGGPDDEDGVTFSGTLTPGGTFDVTYIVTNQGGNSTFIDAWMDFNGDGVFDDSTERILSTGVGSEGTPQTDTVDVPATAQPGTTYARFRVSTSATQLGPTGPTSDGEVEDYKINIEAPQATHDFGDAPDSYGTLLASDGARHEVVAGAPMLGTIDAENDGNPSPGADGDDNQNTDDEDGVLIATTFTPGKTDDFVQLTVTAPGFINMWVDFNKDGVFNHPTEQTMFDNPVDPTTDFQTFPTLESAVGGETYARFRISSVQGLGPTGPASDGEVEDYKVNIAAANPTAPILGEADRFAILASQAVATTVGSAVSNGDIGILDQARTFITGFTPGADPGTLVELTNGLSYAPDDVPPFTFPVPHASSIAFINQVRTDLGIAYTFLAADPNPGAPTQVLPTELGGLTLTRGVYKTAFNVTIQTGALTLDAQGDPNSVWVFTIDGTLTTGAPGGSIVLANGAQAKNVYWRTAGKTTIGPSTIFYGNVFAFEQINVVDGAAITGRLFSVNEQVTLIANAVIKPN